MNSKNNLVKSPKYIQKLYSSIKKWEKHYKITLKIIKNDYKITLKEKIKNNGKIRFIFLTISEKPKFYKIKIIERNLNKSCNNDSYKLEVENDIQIDNVVKDLETVMKRKEKARFYPDFPF
ncbi:MAG: hypothetical protein EU541_08505 [Promethearchaeota archaeon]|nr:MAG: hypothetical protein EU541_08505 [Candidatus Lokiarchaeota archaeon]